MKTYRNLYPQVWDLENLYLAYRKAIANPLNIFSGNSFVANRPTLIIEYYFRMGSISQG